MKKIVAILTKKGMLCDDLQENIDVNIFILNEEHMVGYEKVILKSKEPDSFFEILKSKKINLVYMNHINNELRNLFHKAGCLFKEKEDCINDGFINRFIFS